MKLKFSKTMLTNEELQTLNKKLSQIFESNQIILSELRFSFQDLINLSRCETTNTIETNTIETKRMKVSELKDELIRLGYEKKRLFGTRDDLIELLNTGKNVYDSLPDPENGDSKESVRMFFFHRPHLYKRRLMYKLCAWRRLRYNPTGIEDELLLTLQNSTRLGILSRIPELIEKKKRIEDMSAKELISLCEERGLEYKKSYKKETLQYILKQ